jgi:hypothetical protein
MKKFMPDDDEEIIINNDSVLQRKMDDIGREWREKLEENRQSVKNKSSEEMKIEDLQDTPRKIQDRNMKSFKDL